MEDLREIYEKLLVGKVSDDDKLDEDELFRKEPVFIVDQNSGKKYIKEIVMKRI